MKEEAPFLPGFEPEKDLTNSALEKPAQKTVQKLDPQFLPEEDEEKITCAMCEIYGGQGCPRHRRGKNS